MIKSLTGGGYRWHPFRLLLFKRTWGKLWGVSFQPMSGACFLRSLLTHIQTATRMYHEKRLVTGESISSTNYVAVFVCTGEPYRDMVIGSAVLETCHTFFGNALTADLTFSLNYG